MTDREIIGEVLRLVEEGVSVKLPVNGVSMLPFIVGGRDSVILRKPEDPKVGDVVLALVDGQHYVIHRVIKIEGEQVTLMGDGNIAGTEMCNLSDIRALATHVVKGKGNQRYLYSDKRMFLANVWMRLVPVRKYLLAIYRRI